MDITIHHSKGVHPAPRGAYVWFSCLSFFLLEHWHVTLAAGASHLASFWSRRSSTSQSLSLLLLHSAVSLLVHWHSALADQAHHLASDRVALDCSSETDSRGSFACGVDCPRRDVGYVLDQLTFGHSRITCIATTIVTFLAKNARCILPMLTFAR